MGNNTKIAIAAFFAALALLALAGITLHETVFLWFLAACAAAYVACVSEVIIRRRHRTLAASGIGSILFIAFGIAFLRQWGLAFNADPDAMSTAVDSEHPDLYFYLAAAAGAATLLLLVAGSVLPGRGRRPRGAGHAHRRRTASGARGPASRPTAARRAPSRTAPSRTATPRPASRSAAGTRAQTTKTAKPQSDRVPAPRAASSGLKRPASPAGGTAAKSPAKSPAASSARPSARTSPRR
ncbi:hypothetical protein J2W14_002168 [Pseudarthrobacter oxydans]|nr:hypothetical protein [Pseudarthrobacter oxydans]